MKKFKKKYVIAVAVIALVIILPLLFLFGRNDKRESNGILWNGKQWRVPESRMTPIYWLKV